MGLISSKFCGTLPGFTLAVSTANLHNFIYKRGYYVLRTFFTTPFVIFIGTYIHILFLIWFIATDCSGFLDVDFRLFRHYGDVIISTRTFSELIEVYRLQLFTFLDLDRFRVYNNDHGFVI